MGRAYYYFAASLPMVRWGGPLPLSTEEFCETAKRLMNETDGALIDRLMAGEEDIETDNSLAKSWMRFSRDFRNEMAVFRAHQIQRDPKKAVRGYKENEPQLRGIINEVAKMDNLLDAQKLLDKVSWQFLDGLADGHHFDLEYLICYGLKLKILERFHTIQLPKGKEIYEELKKVDFPEEIMTL